MKHLAMRAILSEDKATCKIWITRQTHIVTNFTDNYTGFKHGNVKFKSRICPEYEGCYGGMHSMYLRGNNTSRDNLPLEVPAEAWPAIKAAVKAYNEKFAEEKIKAPSITYTRRPAANAVIQGPLRICLF